MFHPTLVVWNAVNTVVGIALLSARFEHTGDVLSKIVLFSVPFPVSNNGIIWIQYLNWFLVLICIITFPKSILEMTDKKRAGLILSHSISRNDLISQYIIGVGICLFIHMIIATIIYSTLVIIKLSVIPYGFISASLVLPLWLLFLVIMISFITLAVKSYGLSVFILLLYNLVLSPALLYRNNIYADSVNASETVKIILEVLYHLLPRFQELITMPMTLISKQYLPIDTTVAILLSYSPVIILLYFKINKMEF